MQHRHCVEAVDHTLKNIYHTNKSFGGITVVLSKDFSQILLVVLIGVREQIIGASLRRSMLWKDIHVLMLDQNMRLNNTDYSNLEFAKFLMEVIFNLLSLIYFNFKLVFIYKKIFFTFLGWDQSERNYRTSINNTPVF